ncbi:DUF3014 domain-containing protein [Litorivivens sp.]|uniref:DUF3014 domain-containing protein n=1 Tax=Litorivivens sp. TaxID=2020868 RepID=UPI003561AD3D
MNGKVILAILVVISGAVGYVFYSSTQSEWNEVEPVSESAESTTKEDAVTVEPEPKSVPKKDPAPVVEAPAPTPAPKVTTETEQEEPKVAAPDLVTAPKSVNNSDARVKEAITDLAQRMVRWMVPAEQVRKWVLTIDLVADGKIPYKHAPIKYDRDPFLVLPAGDETYVSDSGNYSRWDDLIGVISEVPVQDAARYYREWLPLFEKAYDELGKQGNFHDRFMAALGQVRSVSEPPMGATLVRPHIFYQFADPELEAASALTKWMWRLGPENMLELQDFARNLSAELTYR